MKTNLCILMSLKRLSNVDGARTSSKVVIAQPPELAHQKSASHP